jgi:hypothetical protein
MQVATKTLHMISENSPLHIFEKWVEHYKEVYQIVK